MNSFWKHRENTLCHTQNHFYSFSNFSCALVNCLEHDPNFTKGNANAKDLNSIEIDDGFDRQVSALPHSITCRFGEVVFAQGGTGYGWWPCQIYDPRKAMDATVRQTAQKYLRSRYLVYFFNCGKIEVIGTSSRSASSSGNTHCATGGSYNESVSHHVNPFAVLPTKMIKSWLTGMSEELYLGRAAKAHGKQRYREFRDAFQMASLEHDKPKRSEQPRSRSYQQSHASPIMGADKFVRKEPFLSPSPIKKHLSPTKLLLSSHDTTIKKGNRRKESVKEPAVQWFHITIQNQVQHDRVAATLDDDVHPAFACFATMDEAKEDISDVIECDRDATDVEPIDNRQIVFSCPWPPLLTHQAHLLRSDEKKSQTRSSPGAVSDANQRSPKPVFSSESIEPVNQRGKRQRSSRNLGGDGINLETNDGSPEDCIVGTPSELKRKRGRPKKN
jgi:PWWP domain